LQTKSLGGLVFANKIIRGADAYCKLTSQLDIPSSLVWSFV